eukprot:g4396.t1
MAGVAAIVNASRCDIDRRADLSKADFLRYYVSVNRPVILRNRLPHGWPARERWKRGAFIQRYGHQRLVTVRSSDSTQRYSIAGDTAASRVTTVGAFLNYSSSSSSGGGGSGGGSGDLLLHDAADATDADPPYTFGGIDPEKTALGDDFRIPDLAWGAFAWYAHRPGAAKKVPAATVAQRKRRTWFFSGQKGTGAQMHAHTPALNTVVYGEKKWFLAPPGVTWALPSAVGQAARAVPAGCRGRGCKERHESSVAGPGGGSDKRESSARWLVKHRAGKSGAAPHAVLECTQRAGETMYIPDMWNHATLNTREVVGVAMELGPPSSRLLDPWGDPWKKKKKKKNRKKPAEREKTKRDFPPETERDEL